MRQSSHQGPRPSSTQSFGEFQNVTFSKISCFLASHSSHISYPSSVLSSFLRIKTLLWQPQNQFHILRISEFSLFNIPSSSNILPRIVNMASRPSPAASDVHVIDHEQHDKDLESSDSPPPFTLTDHHPILADKLARKLTARQVQMIAIGGTIGTGLFLGTGKSLATGGPASMLIAYFIIGGIVLLTMLALGEMAAFVPIAGSFCTFAGRYVDDSLGFALTWNYWFNDAVSTAADLVALQLVFAYWKTSLPGYALSLIFWVLLILANIITVKAYGEVRRGNLDLV